MPKLLGGDNWLQAKCKQQWVVDTVTQKSATKLQLRVKAFQSLIKLENFPLSSEKREKLLIDNNKRTTIDDREKFRHCRHHLFHMEQSTRRKWRKSRTTMHNRQEESKQIVETPSRSLDPVEFMKRQKSIFLYHKWMLFAFLFGTNRLGKRVSRIFGRERKEKYLFNAQNSCFGRDSYHVGKVGKGAKPIMNAFSWEVSGTEQGCNLEIEFVI